MVLWIPLKRAKILFLFANMFPNYSRFQSLTSLVNLFMESYKPAWLAQAFLTNLERNYPRARIFEIWKVCLVWSLIVDEDQETLGSGLKSI